MIEFTNGGRLVETVGELPHFDSVRVLYADFETTSHDPKKKSVNPWHDCWVAGLAVTVNDVFGAWYIPTRHVFGPCLPEEIVIEWWFDLVNRAELWVNSNIKYDAHVSANALGVIPTCPLYDIITHMKIIDSDRALKGGYGLDMLSKQILGEDISRYENALQPYLNKNKDYGRIPADICGEYACQDVITARRLHKFIEQTRPEDSASVAAIELELTGVLYGIERTGMCVDEIELAVEEIAVCNELITLDQRLARLVGRTINPISGDDCFDVLCNQYGLPVVAWTEEDDEDTGEKQGNPSFNKHVWPVYLQHPYAPKEIVQCIFEYRTLSHFRSLFLKQYQQLRFTDGRLHSDYNQCVSTGRMGCKKPNAQQLSKRAKKLIHPPPGFAFLSQDQCLPAGTLLPTPYGDKTIEQVAHELLPVLGYTADGELRFCATSRGSRIGYGAIWRITFDDGSTFECTPEHGFERYEGGRVNCNELQAGDRLKHVVDDASGVYPRWRVNGHLYAKHVLSAEWALGEPALGCIEHVHHKDEDKSNWRVDNLVVKDKWDHLSEHAVTSYARQDHTLRIEKLREALKNRRSYNDDQNPNWQGGKIVCACEKCGARFDKFPSQSHKRFCSHGCESLWRSEWMKERHDKVSMQYACENCGVEFEVSLTAKSHKRYCSRSCANKRTARLGRNYRVVSVEHVRDDWYYSITVPETGQYVTTNGLVNFNSQIEFRVIADYIEAWPVINAYIDNPDTDFHEWVAESAGMARKPAKTMNFMMGYGGGKKKAVKTLKAVTSVIGNVKIEVDRLVAEGAVMQQDALAVFDRMCESKAERVYDNYHATLPSLKSTAREAMEVCKARGYIRNRFGRRRHLPRDASHKAFNSLCQGFAADIQKERTVAMARAIRGTPIQMVANVHDETLSQAPIEVLSDRRVQVAMSYLLERPNVEMRVPLRVSTGYSTQHWCEASTDKKDGGPGEPLVYSAEERKWLESHKDDPLYFLK